MRRNRISIVVGILAVASVPLLAAVKWNSGPSLTVSGTSLLLSGKATGLGNVPNINFTVTGTIEVSSRCYTRSNNTPQAANKQELVEVNATFSSPVRNGQTTLNGVLVATATSTLDCPGGQRVVLEDFTFNLTLSADGFPELLTTFSS